MFKFEVTGSFYIVRFNNFGKGGGIPSLSLASKHAYYVHTMHSCQKCKILYIEQY